MSERKLLLALETSGRSGSVALATVSQDTIEIVDEVLDPAIGSARTLAPAIDRVLHRCNAVPRDLHAIAVVQGPGSFTGLRVGAATAKAMAWALKSDLLSVDGLDCIAAQYSSLLQESDTTVPARLFALVDAYRGQWFVAEFHACDRGWNRVTPTHVEEAQTLVDRIARVTDPTWVVSPSISKIAHTLESQMPTSAQPFVQILNDERSHPNARTVASLAVAKWRQGDLEDVWAFLPKYYRSSAAEEKASR